MVQTEHFQTCGCATVAKVLRQPLLLLLCCPWQLGGGMGYICGKGTYESMAEFECAHATFLTRCTSLLLQ